MAFPPVGTVFRVRVQRRGGTEDALTHDGDIHVRGDLEVPNAYAVEMVERHSGYAVAEVADEADPSEVITIHDWREQQETEEADPQQKIRDAERLREDPVDASKKNPWRKPDANTDDSDEDSDDEEQDDLLGSKNDLLNGKQ